MEIIRKNFDGDSSSGCTRIRFTKPDKDGNVQQYLVKQDPRDIGFKDLSGMGSLAKADELMQQWA